jgi:hypothetical protein
MQLLIIATSNHNWINLLTIVLCLFLLDDGILRKIVPAPLHRFISLQNHTAVKTEHRWRQYALPVFAALILFSSITAFGAMVSSIKYPEALARTTFLVRSWGIGNIFHVFPTMQTERQELQIEGSNDGIEWKSYGFKYKPGAVDKRPEFIVPHQPRLDWMIWFVPPRNPDMLYWFERFLSRLHEGSTDVLDLLDYNPFPDNPPAYLRVQAFQYRFTTREEYAQTGNWWQREYLGEFPFVRPRMP